MSFDPDFQAGHTRYHGSGDSLEAASPCYLDASSEKGLLSAGNELRQGNAAKLRVSDASPRGLFKLFIFILVAFGTVILSLWSISNEIDAEAEGYGIPSEISNLVKDAVLTSSSSSAPASTSTLEVFQVYQPVLSPSGAIDETVSSDGTENTTTISQTAAKSNCEALLMEYSFGWSYGMPFVGK